MKYNSKRLRIVVPGLFTSRIPFPSPDQQHKHVWDNPTRLMYERNTEKKSHSAAGELWKKIGIVLKNV